MHNIHDEQKNVCVCNLNKYFAFVQSLDYASFKFKSSLLRCLQPLRFGVFHFFVSCCRCCRCCHIVGSSPFFFVCVVVDTWEVMIATRKERRSKEIGSEIGLDQKLIGSKLNHNSIAEMRQTSTVCYVAHSYRHQFPKFVRSQRPQIHNFLCVFIARRLAQETDEKKETFPVIFLLFEPFSTGYTLITALYVCSFCLVRQT